MFRNVVLIVALMSALSISLPSSAVAMPTDPLTILPKDCKILAGKELSLTLDGLVPPNTTITWNASDGGITSMLDGSDTIFVAPFKSTVVTISISLSPAVPGMESLITRQCIVILPNSAPDGVAQVEEMVRSSIPGLRFPSY